MALALALLRCVEGPARAQRGGSEASLKAAMIQKIAAFVRWPSAASEPGKRSFVLAVLGDAELSARLRFLYQREQIDGRPVRIVDVADAAALPACDALFIGAAFADSVESVLRALAKRPVLTLAATPGLAQRGVAINLFVDASQRVRFEINRVSMEGMGLKASYQLLSVARLVEAQPGGVR